MGATFKYGEVLKAHNNRSPQRVQFLRYLTPMERRGRQSWGMEFVGVTVKGPDEDLGRNKLGQVEFFIEHMYVRAED